jgi:hypothetical protein
VSGMKLIMIKAYGIDILLHVAVNSFAYVTDFIV